MKPKTLYEKLWESHVVTQEPDCPALLYIDLHLIHEATSAPAFNGLQARGLKVKRPERTVATIDHLIPTTDRSLPIQDEQALALMQTLRNSATKFGITLFDIDSGKQGIVHVIGPEMGLTQPGMTIVCGDSHTSTHGAVGALAFGIGTSEVEYVLATQCLLQHKMKTFEVRVDGKLQKGCTSKDVILSLLSKIGVSGGTGYVFEYTGSCIKSLSMEQRMTICNMSIEGGARAGLVAPDETTCQYLNGKEFSPKGKEWDLAVERWKKLPTDEGAKYDRTITIDASSLVPMITYGTNPGMAIPITEKIPDPAKASSKDEQASMEKALNYIGLKPGQSMIGQPVNVVFIGSCTNSRISDLRLAATLLKGRRVKSKVMVVPGSQQIKKQAESEALDKIFKDAGCEWREPGCSMCIAMNGDLVNPGDYCISTSNRNFEGRQGQGARTFLASPLTAAASAITGAVEDPRRWIQ